jgi:RimJ/RimL family protein N-acetyltransferase
MKSTSMAVRPVILNGRTVRLEPLNKGHTGELTEAARYAEVWTYLDELSPSGERSVAALIREALDQQSRGERVAFAMMEQMSGRAVGSISYVDIRRTHRSVEIGLAWITPSRWRTGMAREAGYLLLRHAFEAMGAIRVCLTADSRDQRSQRAIEGLHATYEGVLRNYRALPDGTARHSACYSVIREEWPQVSAKIAAELTAPPTGA